MPKRIRIWGWFQLKKKKKKPTWGTEDLNGQVSKLPHCSSVFLESSSSGILGSQSKRGNTTKSVYIYIYTLPHIRILYAIQELWLPWWFSGRVHLPMQETDSVPGLGRFPVLQSDSAHNLQLLSLSSRAWKLQLLSPRARTTGALEAALPNKRSHRNERCPHITMKSSPHSPQLKRRPHSDKDAARPKINQSIKLFWKSPRVLFLQSLHK